MKTGAVRIGVLFVLAFSLRAEAVDLLDCHLHSHFNPKRLRVMETDTGTGYAYELTICKNGGYDCEKQTGSLTRDLVKVVDRYEPAMTFRGDGVQLNHLFGYFTFKGIRFIDAACQLRDGSDFVAQGTANGGRCGFGLPKAVKIAEQSAKMICRPQRVVRIGEPVIEDRCTESGPERYNETFASLFRCVD